MSSSSDGFSGSGLASFCVISLGISIPILIMLTSYFICSPKYRCCKNTRTRAWCCNLRGNDAVDSDTDSILLDVLERRSEDENSHRDIYRISSTIGFETIQELQTWYNNFEGNRSAAEAGSSNITRNNRRNNTTGRITPPPSYASLYSYNDDVPSYDDLPKLV